VSHQTRIITEAIRGLRERHIVATPILLQEYFNINFRNIKIFRRAPNDYQAFNPIIMRVFNLWLPTTAQRMLSISTAGLALMTTHGFNDTPIECTQKCSTWSPTKLPHQTLSLMLDAGLGGCCAKLMRSTHRHNCLASTPRRAWSNSLAVKYHLPRFIWPPQSRCR